MCVYDPTTQQSNYHDNTGNDNCKVTVSVATGCEYWRRTETGAFKFSGGIAAGA